MLLISLTEIGRKKRFWKYNIDYEKWYRINTGRKFISFVSLLKSFNFIFAILR